jgi:hypothetical protein
MQVATQAHERLTRILPHLRAAGGHPMPGDDAAAESG